MKVWAIKIVLFVAGYALLSFLTRFGVPRVVTGIATLLLVYVIWKLKIGGQAEGAIQNEQTGGTVKDDSGPMPTRKLNFQFAPIPENGEKFSNKFREAVKDNEKTELDYSVDNVKFVDNFLQKFRNEGLTVNDFAETIFVAGSYVGQIMVEQNGGLWIKREDANLPEGVSMMPIIIRLPNGTVTDPIGKAFKRFYNGDVDSLAHFYQVFTADKS
jgi:hypothetical protein